MLLNMSGSAFPKVRYNGDWTPKQLHKKSAKLTKSERKEYERCFFPTAVQAATATKKKSKSGLKTFCKVLLENVAQVFRVG